MHVGFPGIEGQNTHAVSVFTAHAHGITIDTTVTQWTHMPVKTKEKGDLALQNQRVAQSCDVGETRL